MSFTVYILQSERDGGYYFGHSQDLDKRLKRHNSGKVRSTKSRKPWAVHYTEVYPTKSEAYRREMYFKSLEGRIWLKEQGII